jgi:hypothetical protein
MLPALVGLLYPVAVMTPHVDALTTCQDCRAVFNPLTFAGCPVCASNAVKRDRLNHILPTTPLTGAGGV